MSSLRAATRTFRKEYLQSGMDFAESWGEADSRFGRYRLFDGMYDNTAFDELANGGFAAQLKVDYKLVKEFSQLYNPAFKLVEAISDLIWGGDIDPNAGDGEIVKTALPIALADESLRPRIARLFRDSRWSIEKDRVTHYGAKLGDVGIRVVDDPEGEKVSLEVVHPGTIQWVRRDRITKAVTAYCIEEMRPDPRIRITDTYGSRLDVDRKVRYTEYAWLEDGVVSYETYLEDELYAWGDESDWTVTQDFIPLVLIAHKSIGVGWGHNCFHAHVGPFMRVDDQASALNQQIRKALKSPTYLAGVRPTEKLTVDNSNDNLTTMFGPTGSQPYPMTFNLNIADASANISQMMKSIESNYPELDIGTSLAASDATGRALRVKRQRPTKQIQSRRAAYDGGLIDAIAMALAMGGAQGYEGYEGISIEDYDKIRSEISISLRPVFESDPLDELEEEARWLANVEAALRVDIDPETYYKINGAPKWKIELIRKSREKRQQERLAEIAMSQNPSGSETSANPQNGPTDTQPPDKKATGVQV